MPDPVVPPAGEDLALVAVQSALAGRPGVLATARGLSQNSSASECSRR